jgi:hypothetical protein
MDVSDWVSVVLVLLAGLSLVVAWHQWREVVRRRHVDMFWRMFDVYNSDELRDSRDAFFEIEEELQLPRPSGRTPRITNGTELRDYSTKYWREFYEGDLRHQRLDRLARAPRAVLRSDRRSAQKATCGRRPPLRVDRASS